MSPGREETVGWKLSRKQERYHCNKVPDEEHCHRAGATKSFFRRGRRKCNNLEVLQMGRDDSEKVNV